MKSPKLRIPAKPGSASNPLTRYSLLGSAEELEKRARDKSRC